MTKHALLALPATKKIQGSDGRNAARHAPGRGGVRRSGRRVLDVGCGYGRLLALLQAAGLEPTGVDLNPEIVAANRKAGLSCISTDEFESSNDGTM